MPGLPHSLHALVTGGGRGIGREIASALTQAGATVTVLGRNRAILDEAHRASDTLIVLGVAARPSDALLFGSTADQLLETSRSSLLFVAS